MPKTISIGMRSREARADSKGADRDKRRVPITWSTGERVLTWDPELGSYWEELSMEPDAVDMSRVNAGKVPILKDHDRSSLSSQLGILEDGVLDGGVGKGFARFSKRDDVEPIYQDVLDDITSGTSVGYQVRQLRYTGDADDGLPIYLATKWTPYEVSFLSVPAEVGSGTRAAYGKPNPCEVLERKRSANEGDSMPPEITQPAAAAPAPAAPAQAAAAPVVTEVNQEAARKEGAQAERKRVSMIKEAVRAANLDENFADKLIEGGDSIERARELIINEFATRGTKPSVTARVEGSGQDETETRRRSIESAILHRFDSKKFALEANGREYMSASLLDIARDLLEAKGEKVRGLSKNELAARAITTSDLPGIVANVANKSLRDAYQSAPQTFRPFCREVELPDFKPVNRTQLGDAPALEAVGEDGSVKRGKITDGTESYSLGEFAKILPITRKTIINDDMGALTRIPMLFGRAAADLESDLVYTGSSSLFGANSGAGQTLMVDSKAVFHTAHGNLASVGAAIGVDTIGAGRAAMRQQKNLQGRPINVTPEFILVPTAKETLADQFVSTAMLANMPSSTNPFAGRLKVLSEPRLDALSGTAWYLIAQYGQIDIIEIAYLAGQKGVYFETRQGFEVEGIEFKARLDVAVKFIDYRGVYKNPGA